PREPQGAELSFYRGLALINQGKDEAAIAELHKCLTILPGHVRARQQLDHTRRLMDLEKRLPALLAGDSVPAADQLALADAFVRYKQRYGDSAALFARAFAADPKSAEDLRPSHRYNAACAAAQAATGAEAGTRSAPDRTRLRRQALAWY